MKGEELQARVADGNGNDEVGIPKGNELKHNYPNPEYFRIENLKDTVSIRNLNYPQI
jgi:hypothetical protein